VGFVDYIERRRVETGDEPAAQLFQNCTKSAARRMANEVTAFFGGQRGWLQRLGVESPVKLLYSLRQTSTTRLN